LGSIVLLGAAVWIVVGVATLALTALIAGYIGIAFFGICALYAGYRLVCHRPSLVVDESGMTDSASLLGVGYMTWQEISHVHPYKEAGRGMLGVFPKDLDSVLSRQPPLRRLALRLGGKWTLAPIGIPDATLPITAVDLAQLLHTRFGVKVRATEQEQNESFEHETP
jgi:hypothetical protein